MYLNGVDLALINMICTVKLGCECRSGQMAGDVSDREPEHIPSLHLSQTAYIQVAGGVHR